MISLFAFIVSLGIVVDDAINIGEAVQRYREAGHSRLHAAPLGVREVALPVCFAIATTIVAYAPMLFVPGVSGKFFRNVPLVVIAVLLVSLFESLFVLPAHPAHSKESKRGFIRWIDDQQEKIGRGLDWFVRRLYLPVVRAATGRRYLSMAIGLALLLSTCGVVGGGHLRFTFMPEIESDQVTFEARLPFGTSVERTRDLEAVLVETANEVLTEHGGARISRGVFSQVGVFVNRACPGRRRRRTGTDPGPAQELLRARRIRADRSRVARERVTTAAGPGRATCPRSSAAPGSAAVVARRARPAACSRRRW